MNQEEKIGKVQVTTSQESFIEIPLVVLLAIQVTECMDLYYEYLVEKCLKAYEH